MSVLVKILYRTDQWGQIPNSKKKKWLGRIGVEKEGLGLFLQGSEILKINEDNYCICANFILFFIII
jgi:hypothetical protein